MGQLAVRLNDKFEKQDGEVYLTGMQAVVRLLLDQKRTDASNGLNTAGFVSGYRGSPLGALDTALWRAGRELNAHDIIFQPGVNEELAATAVYGSQQLEHFESPKRDGVFAAWYGKGPGVDRAGDALKHGNLAGAAAHGGVLVIAGDDHPGKSSTTCHQSEQALAASMIPVLYPSNAEDYLRLGAFGYALSRFSGLWAGFKCVNDTADSTITARLSRTPKQYSFPDIERPPEGLNLIVNDDRFAQEARTVNFRLPAAQAFARANNIDEVIFDATERRFGIITAGKAYLDVIEALSLLGIDARRAAALGIGVLKLGLTWPVDADGLRDFSARCREIMVIEEKRPFIEPQVKDSLYHLPADDRPRVSGKTTPEGAFLLAASGELGPADIAAAIIDRLRAHDIIDDALASAIDRFERQARVPDTPSITTNIRMPYFCSGCPHNRSTKTPDGAIALAGIGCHVMAAFMPHRKHVWPVQMGGEGANWIGAEQFVTTSHIFQNIGDGTYYHSGILAIRAAIAAKSNITYKLLFNDAVAMTGGQPTEGQLTVGQIAGELLEEGAVKVVVVTDDIHKYAGQPRIPAGVDVHPRAALGEVQEELSERPGVTVLIYDQVCAAEKRRRRKRGAYPDPQRRLFINEQVCEGCGDCGDKSNCVSLQPVETPFGRKRRIDQSSCNKDYSCVEGFCPSFVSVVGGRLRSRTGAGAVDIPDLPDATPAQLDDVLSVLIAGVGGTGVVTIGAVLGMAAHMEGKAASIMDVTGLSQKNGAVYSHLRLAPDPGRLRSAKIGRAGADILLGCDMVAAATGEALAAIRTEETAMIINADVSAVAAFTFMPDIDMDVDVMARRLQRVSDRDRSAMINASALARRLLGDSIGANMMVVGAALQLGLLPLSVRSVEEAARLNGVAVDMNVTALRLGRWAVVDPAALAAVAGVEDDIDAPKEQLSTAYIAEHRRQRLIAYQNAAYADRYMAVVREAENAERRAGLKGCGFSEAVARYAFKLMAYKDEYEVARLYTDGEFLRRLKEEFEGDFKLQFHMAPPLIAPKDRANGALQKLTFGPWMMPALRVLAKLRRLRGTVFDPFGRTQERRAERALIDSYEAMITELSGMLSGDNAARVTALAAYPEAIRGYGHVKEANLKEAAEKRDRVLSELRNASEPDAGPLAQTG